MSQTFRHRLLVWAWGAFAAIFGGALTAFGQAAGIATVNGLIPHAIQPMTMNQFGAALVAGACSGLFMYYQTPKGKLPPIDEEPESR